MTALDPTRRQQVLERIAAWLEEWPDSEPLPAGIDPGLATDTEPAPDLAALLGALVALRHDVQIQGKAVKRLTEHLEARIAEAEAAEAAEAAQTESPRLDADLLNDLFDLYDALQRGVAAGRAQRDALTWLGRLGGAGDRLAAVVDGFAAIADRLREALDRCGVEALGASGAPFDPRTMRAIDSVPARGAVEAGRVAETVREGFVCGERILRLADVRVAR